jgi:hypothetical protein
MPEKSTHCGNSNIIGRRNRSSRTIRRHSTKLDQLKQFSVTPDTTMPEEDWVTICYDNGQGRGCEDRKEHKQTERRHRAVQLRSCGVGGHRSDFLSSLGDQVTGAIGPEPDRWCSGLKAVYYISDHAQAGPQRSSDGPGS